MRVVLKIAGERLGTTEWDKLPMVGQVGLFTSEDGRSSSVRGVDKIEGGPAGEKIVHLGSAQPTFVYSR
jgi:hypothetical protein